jgi:magnesium-transporting ATPase (P-type)
VRDAFHKVKIETSKAHRQEISQVIKDNNTDMAKGLTSAEAELRYSQQGPNELRKKDPESLWEKVKE